MQKFEEQEEEVKQWRLTQQRANVDHDMPTMHDVDDLSTSNTSRDWDKGKDKGCDCGGCTVQ